MIPKFRAWDKTTNQMRGCYGFNELEREVYVCSVADDEFNGQLKTVHALRRSFDEVVVMQSTGLFDKNGVEVYEGDIVKDQYGDVKVVNWYKGAFVITYIVLDGKGRKFTYSYLNNGLNHHSRYEVIGNIYENPELLEVVE